MQTKLTISLDKQVIDQAKLYAKKRGRSLSDMIENYLKAVTQKENQTNNISSEIKKLQGSVKLQENFDYKKELQKSFNKKYQL